LIISIFALVIAMSAGAYAVTIAPKNSVLSSSIKNKNVKTADIKPGAVKKKSLAGNSVDGSKIVDGQVGTADIGDGQVGTADIGDGQVGLNDLSTAAKTDLNDATTLGGLTVAQIVAASGGEYLEGNQSGDADINVSPVSPVDLVSLNIPHAGKWLITARIPYTCTWNGTGGSDPDPEGAGLDQPYFFATGYMNIGGNQVAKKNSSCEAEAGGLAFIVPIVQGQRTIEFTTLYTATAPTTIQLQGSRVDGLIGGASKVSVDASGAQIQAITVQ
jgi:hypothetical protein